MDITVVGRHRYTVTPDLGQVTLLVVADRSTPAEAAVAAADVVAEVTRQLTLLTGPDGPVTRHAVDPLGTCPRPPYGHETISYQMTHRATARIRACFADALGLASFVARWAPLPDIALLDIDWEVSESRRARVAEDALGGAVADAFHRARIIATTAGALDVTVVEFTESGTSEAPSAPGQAPTRTGDQVPILPPDREGTVVITGRFRTTKPQPPHESTATSPRRAW
ncbi:MAG: SIMPL domain-containing protein [Propioniciclava sp.]